MNKYEERIINESVEVQQVVIGVMDLHARQRLAPPYERWAEEVNERTKRAVKKQLLDRVEKYIKVTVNEDRQFVEGVIYMPYVRDEIVEGLDRDVKRLHQSVSILETRNVKMSKRIQYLEKLWFVRLHLAVKRYFK